MILRRVCTSVAFCHDRMPCASGPRCFRARVIRIEQLAVRHVTDPACDSTHGHFLPSHTNSRVVMMWPMLLRKAPTPAWFWFQPPVVPG